MSCLPVMLELGELEHVNDCQNLKLQTKISLSLSPIAPLFLSELTDLESLLSAGTWIAGGNRLQIRVRFIFHDIVTDSDNDNIVEDIGAKICNAEIWSQLGLDATHSLCGDDAEGSSLSDDFIVTLTAKVTRHTNVNAPSIVPSACLEGVSLHFDLSACRRTRNSSSSQDQSTVLNSQAPYTTSFDLQGSNNMDAACESPQSKQQCSRGDPDLHGREQDWARSSSKERRSIAQIAPVSPSLADATPATQCSRSGIASLSLETERSYPPCGSWHPQKYTTQKVKFEHVLGILDASLRLTICGRTTFKSEGIILSKDSGFPRLVGVSPALFSPHFHEAISQRHHILPSIVHTMCGFFGRTTSRSLQEKSERLSECLSTDELAHHTIISDGSPPSNAAMSAAVQRRLWSLMQNELLDPDAWPRRKFEILSAVQKSCAQEMGSHMLDERLTVDNAKNKLDGRETGTVLESQNTDNEMVDETESIRAQCPNEHRYLKGNCPADELLAGDTSYWPECKIGSDDRRAEDDSFYRQIDNFEADEEQNTGLFHETDLSWSKTDQQGSGHDIHRKLPEDTASAEQNDPHCSQVSSKSFNSAFQYEPWTRDREEMLDKEHTLNDHGPWLGIPLHHDTLEEDQEILDERYKVFNDSFASYPVEEGDLLDVGNEIRYPNQALSESSARFVPWEMDQEMLDDTQINHHNHYTWFDRMTSHTCREDNYWDRLDDTDIVVDHQITSMLDCGFAENLFQNNEDEVVDGGRMICDTNQWDEAPLTV